MSDYRYKEFFDRDKAKAGTEIIGGVGERAVSLWDDAFGEQPDDIFALTVEEEGEDQRLLGIYSHYEGARGSMGIPSQKNNQQCIFQIDKTGNARMIQTVILLTGQTLIYRSNY